MPTVTTTVTSACASGATTTVTTTEASPEPAAASPVTAAPQAPKCLKDGVDVNSTTYAKVGVPTCPEEITVGWFDKVFHTRGIIGDNVSITEIDSKQIGEGRGYANYTFLVKLKFSRPVHKDVPQAVAVKICNQTFQENILETKSEAMWKFFNDFYVCESRFYTDYRSSLSCACADIYWTELEYPEDPYTQFGHYGVMIEYLGDDLKMFNIEDGIPNKELQEAMTAFASIHAGSWNDSYCIPIAEGGTNHYINDGNQMPVLWQEFGIGGWEEYKKILTDEVGAKFPKLVADLDGAFKDLPAWLGKGKHGNRCLSSMDLRSENVLWKKTADGSFECVPIDHQAWWVAAPMRDIAMLLITSSQRDQIKPQLMNHVRFYYDALIAAGVSADQYSWAQAQEDFHACVYVALIFGGAMIEMIGIFSENVKTMSPTDEHYQETVNMRDNIAALALTVRSKAVIAYEVLQPECEAAADWVRSVAK